MKENLVAILNICNQAKPSQWLMNSERCCEILAVGIAN
jgi:hypothetical protein